MNILSVKIYLKLLIFIFCCSLNGVSSAANFAVSEGVSDENKLDFGPLGTIGEETAVFNDQNVFDLLFDLDKNRQLLKSKDYRSMLAKSLIYQERIKEFVVIDSYLFRELGLHEDLLKVLEEASIFASKIIDKNRRGFYLCLINASMAGLANFSDDQILWYNRASTFHTSIEQGKKEFEQTKLIALVSKASTLFLSHNTEEAEDIFLKGISLIDEQKGNENDFYLLDKYISFLIETNANDELEQWLNYTLSLANVYHKEYYKALSYYHLMVLKIKQGLPEIASKYFYEYHLSRKKLSARDLVRVAFIESRYRDHINAVFDLDIDGKGVFILLAILVFLAILGVLIYMHYILPKKAPDIGFVDSNSIEIDHVAASQVPLDTVSDEEFVQHIDQLKKLAESNDPLFMKKFNAVFADFNKILSSKAISRLNYAEVSVCAYTKLGYTTKEVAYYRRESIRSVECRKYRIRRKLNLSKDVDFTDWFLGI